MKLKLKWGRPGLKWGQSGLVWGGTLDVTDPGTLTETISLIKPQTVLQIIPQGTVTISLIKPQDSQTFLA